MESRPKARATIIKSTSAKELLQRRFSYVLHMRQDVQLTVDLVRLFRVSGIEPAFMRGCGLLPKSEMAWMARPSARFDPYLSARKSAWQNNDLRCAETGCSGNGRARGR